MNVQVTCGDIRVWMGVSMP